MKISRSKSGELHCETAPAIQACGLTQYWRDGKLHRPDGPAVIDQHSRMYFWRGINIPSKVWAECEYYTYRDLLKLDNLELRRALVEKLGVGHFLQDAELLDTGSGDLEHCRLFRIYDPEEQPPDNVIKFVELRNSTPEPSGEYKMYYLRVPPNIDTVRGAVAWSFNLDDSFCYVKQT